LRSQGKLFLQFCDRPFVGSSKEGSRDLILESPRLFLALRGRFRDRWNMFTLDWFYGKGVDQCRLRPHFETAFRLIAGELLRSSQCSLPPLKSGLVRNGVQPVNLATGD